MGKNEIEHLKNIQLFSSLTDDELHQIKDKLSLKRYKKHEVMLFEEDTTEYMYIILNGKTKVIQTTEDGKEILLAMHHSGEFFGEMSLLDGKTSPATVVAMEDSSVAIISRQEFYSLIRAQKRILDNLLLILCSRLRDSWEKIQLLNLKNASQRIKILFLMLSAKNGGKRVEGEKLNTKLTTREIAEMTGMARETVTRVISKCQKEGGNNILRNKFIHLSAKFLQK